MAFCSIVFRNALCDSQAHHLESLEELSAVMRLTNGGLTYVEPGFDGCDGPRNRKALRFGSLMRASNPWRCWPALKLALDALYAS